MNWKEINDRYPKAFLEWAQKTTDETIKEVENVSGDCIIVNSGRKSGQIYLSSPLIELHLLPTYFDLLGIIVLPEYHAIEMAFGCLIIDLTAKKRFSIAITSSKRDEVLEAAIKYAFKIREKQLTQ